MPRLSKLIAAILPLASMAFVPQSVQHLRTTQSPSFQITPIATQSSTSSSQLHSLTTTDLPEKLYFKKEKELPKVLGGIKIGLRKLVVITGASSGLGLNTATTLAKTGRYFVVMACRDVEKGKKVAKKVWHARWILHSHETRTSQLTKCT